MPPLSLLDASFLCTFCWDPQYPPAKPKVLGREARIACEACWRSVLDLSICWVCGEMVARGEEVVSLGWCFWHRGCFGCLLCGTHLDPPGVGGEELALAGDDEEPTQGMKKEKFCRAVELENIPLCTWCENATESMQDKEVLENGLVNITRKDGGLSRTRLAFLTGLSEINREDLPKEIDRALPKTEIKDVTAISPSCLDPNRPVDVVIDSCEKDSGREKPVRMGQDGNLDRESGCHSPVTQVKSVETPALYVSVLDVVNEPTFRPSKTKPIPKWMTLLPRNRQEYIKNPYPIAPPKAKPWTTEYAPAHDKSLVFRPTPETTNTRLPQPYDSVKESKSIVRPISKINSSLHVTHPESTKNLQSAVPRRVEIESSGIHTSRKSSNPPFTRTDTPYPFAGTTQHRPIFNRSRSFSRPPHTKIVPTLATHREHIIYPAVSTLTMTPFSETAGRPN